MGYERPYTWVWSGTGSPVHLAAGINHILSHACAQISLRYPIHPSALSGSRTYRAQFFNYLTHVMVDYSAKTIQLY